MHSLYTHCSYTNETLTTLILVVDWIKDGIYDFHTLPKAMKLPLKKKDEDKISAIKKAYKEGMHIKSNFQLIMNSLRKYW